MKKNIKKLSAQSLQKSLAKETIKSLVKKGKKAMSNCPEL